MMTQPLFPYLLQSSAFSPDQISGLAGWWDGDYAAGRFQLSDGTLPATDDGDPVGYLADRSGNGRHFIQTSASMRPTVQVAEQNGKAIIRPDGVDDLLSVSLGLSSSSWTIFAVIKPQSGNAPLWDSETGRFILYPHNGPVNGAVGWYDGTFRDTIAAGTVDWQVLTWRFDTAGSTGYVYRDGTLLGSAAHTTIALGGLTALFSVYTGGSYAAHDLAELLIYNSALGVTNRQSVETYLRTKWGTP